MMAHQERTRKGHNKLSQEQTRAVWSLPMYRAVLHAKSVPVNTIRPDVGEAQRKTATTKGFKCNIRVG